MENAKITKETTLAYLRDIDELTERTYNILTRIGMKTIEDITIRDEKYLLKINNLGPKSIEEIIRLLHSNGFYFKDEEVEEKSFTKIVGNLENDNKKINSRIKDKEDLIAKYENLLNENQELQQQEAILDDKIASLLKQIAEKQLKGDEPSGPTK